MYILTMTSRSARPGGCRWLLPLLSPPLALCLRGSELCPRRCPRSALSRRRRGTTERTRPGATSTRSRPSLESCRRRRRRQAAAAEPRNRPAAQPSSRRRRRRPAAAAQPRSSHRDGNDFGTASNRQTTDHRETPQAISWGEGHVEGERGWLDA